MKISAWLPWLRSRAPKRPRTGATRARSSRQLETRLERAAGPQEGDGDDANPRHEGAEATQFMSSREMVEVLADEIFESAGLPSTDRSVRLYSMAAVGETMQQDDTERFILLVKFKTNRDELWEHLPALGARLMAEVKQRLGIDVRQVYWAAAPRARSNVPSPQIRRTAP